MRRRLTILRGAPWASVIALAFVAACTTEPEDSSTDAGGRTADTATADTNLDAPPDSDSSPDVADTGAGPDTGPDAGCVPSRSAWEANVSGMVNQWCAECHSRPLKFGAPYSLVSYDELVAGEPGERRVDAMAEQLLDGSMPPPSSDQPDHVAEDTLVEWATCGQKHPDHSEGVRSSAPPMDAPANPPADTKSFDVTADNFELGENELNRYQCFVIDVPFESERFIRRIEPVVDDSRVLHHALMSIDRDGGQRRDTFTCGGFPPGDGLLYGWAPGQEAIQFDKGGVRVNPGAQLVLQIHYNNGAGAPDVSDSSGVRIHHAPSASPVYSIASLGPRAFAIPPRKQYAVEDTCTVQQETTIVASFPHMHEIGAEFHSEVIRKDGTREPLIDLTGWSFESQLFYQTPMTLQPGDKISTECVWFNPKDTIVPFGLDTEDEMCFNFAYVTPPDAGFCH